MSFKKLFFVTLMFFAILTTVFSQNIINIDDDYIAVNNTIMHKDSLCCTPYDIEDSTHQQFFTNTFSFLIKEDVYYEFKVIRVDYLNNGFGVLMSTKIDGRFVTAYVATLNADRIPKTKKIKRGNYYNLKLTRYIKRPIGRFIENPPIYDVLLQNTIVPVMSIGTFSHIFISQNLIGLNCIDSSKVKEIEKHKLEAKKEIKEIVISFIQKVVIERDTASLLNMADTVLLKKSILDVSWTVGPSMIRSTFKRPPKDLPKYFESNEEDKYSFVETFWFVVDRASGFTKYYKKYYSIENTIVDVLYYHNGFYTVRAFWKYNELPYFGVVYFSMKRENDGYKISGMTKIQ
ncbi:MAG: hypothetical protein RBS19_11755 [Bacteroidales bacterium]|nr:hypothetical protein [Bacteroidales bacterium]